MKLVKGRVVSSKMTNTVTVQVDRAWTHPVYQKTVKRTKKYLAQNLIGAKDGDRVMMQETRPLSRRKRWEIKEILK